MSFPGELRTRSSLALGRACRDALPALGRTAGAGKVPGWCGTGWVARSALLCSCPALPVRSVFLLPTVLVHIICSDNR